MEPETPPTPAEKSSPRLGYYCANGASAGSSAPHWADGPIIATVNRLDTLDEALAAPTRTLYILTGNPLTLPVFLKRAHEHRKLGLVNMDFLEGLTRDRSAVEYLAANGADGIVSTRIETLKAAHALGLLTIQRTFAIDRAAVIATQKALASFCPDAVEVLPAMAAPRVSRRLREDQPGLIVLGGGLIESVKEIEDLLAAGVNAITTSNPRLWLI